jgi:hypothetical protein
MATSLKFIFDQVGFPLLKINNNYNKVGKLNISLNLCILKPGRLITLVNELYKTLLVLSSL